MGEFPVKNVVGSIRGDAFMITQWFYNSKPKIHFILENREGQKGKRISYQRLTTPYALTMKEDSTITADCIDREIVALLIDRLEYMLWEWELGKWKIRYKEWIEPKLDFTSFLCLKGFHFTKFPVFRDWRWAVI